LGLKEVDMSLPIKKLFTLRAGSNGIAAFAPLVPAGAFGLNFYTQALCGDMISNSLVLTIQ
jgi:hypothetical protein